jgi:hypothetical protein
MAEEAKIRGEDIRYSQRQEDAEHLKWLRELDLIVLKVHGVLAEQIKKFEPPEEAQRDAQLAAMARPQDQANQAIPKFMQQGPRKEAS